MVSKLIRLSILAFFTAGIFLFVGCADKDYYDPDRDPNNVGDTPSSLNFSTSQQVKMELNYNVPKGTTSVFDMYAQNPFSEDGLLRSDIKPIAGGIHVAGVSNLSRVIPSYVDELYLVSSSLFVPQLSYAKIESGRASFAQIEVPALIEAETRAGNAGSLWERPVTKYLKGKEHFYAETADGHYQYDIINPDFQKDVPAEVLNAITKTFPEWKRLTKTEYIRDANLKVVKGGAKLYLSVLHVGCTLHNSLSYFVYTGDKTDLSQLTKEEVNQLEIINVFQLADTYKNTVRKEENRRGLTPGKYVQLLYKNENNEYVEEFPEGALVGWRLTRNGLDEATFTVGKGLGSFFSVSAWNDPKKSKYEDVGDSNHTIYFKTEDNDGYTYTCFGFEDQNYKGDEDFNDLIFHVYTDPSDALDPPPTINTEDIEKKESLKGILAFEDNWPKQGDYDLNDVVVKYTSDITYIQRIEKTNGVVTNEGPVTVKSVKDEFSLIHTGADFNNAFSYKVNIDPSLVKKINIDGEDYKMIADGSGFIIDLCTNVRDVIPAMQIVTTPKVYIVEIDFKEGAVSQDGFSEQAAPYNPFISPKETPGAEVHLPMYEPTGRASDSLFGTEDDRSDKKTLWYVSGINNKYPFAIHLSGEDKFINLVEGQKMHVTYENYNKWVDSGMKDYKNWYINPGN